MATYAAELFIQCIYSLDLSYHDLLEAEVGLKARLAEILSEHSGDFVHFEEMGDTMRVQCVFGEYSESLFHELADRIAPLMDGSVEARMLFVSKDLDHLHIYTINRGAWQEACLRVPAAGPLTRALWENDPK